MKKVYTALLLILLAAMFSVGVYSLADYDATGSVSEKREFVKPEFSVKALLDGTYIPALERYYSDTFPGRESLLKANRTLNKFYYYSGSGEDSVLILNQSDSAAQGGESLDAVQKANGQSPQPEQPTSAQPETTTEAPAEPVQVPTDTAGAPQTPEMPEQPEEQPEQPETDPELDTPEESDASYAGSVVVVGNRAMEIPTRLDDLITSYAGAVGNLAAAMGPDVRTISLITPNGGEFYSPESLHTGEHSQKDMIDFCYSQMDDKIITVDAYSKLRSHTDEYIYFRTDHHWTQLGAYYAYTAFCEAAGFDKIFVETVGVGQSETAVHSMVDFFLLIQLAGTGDELQGIKRGIMEMADGIVINKADGSNIEKAKLAASHFRNALHLFPAPDSGWSPKVMTYSGFYGIGIKEIWDMIYEYFAFVKANGYFEYRRNEQAKYWMYESINEHLRDSFYNNEKIISMLAAKEEEVLNGKLTSFVAAKKLLDAYFSTLK